MGGVNLRQDSVNLLLSNSVEIREGNLFLSYKRWLRRLKRGRGERRVVSPWCRSHIRNSDFQLRPATRQPPYLHCK